MNKISKYPYLIILIFSIIVYFQTLFFGFVDFDDDFFHKDKSQIIEQFTNLKATLEKTYINSYYYRPVVNLSLFIDYQLGGGSSFAYHFTNLLIHCITSCLVFILLGKLKYNRSQSLIFALIFAVHPILINAEIWIVGRNDMFVAMFSIISFIFLIDYLKQEKSRYLILHCIALILAIFSKETAFATPIVMALYWLIFFRTQKFKTKTIIFLILVWILSIMLMPFLKYIITGQEFTDKNFNIYNIFINYRAIPETISKVFLPINIFVLPTYKLFPSIFGTIILIFAIIYISIRKNHLNTSKILFGFLWFLILYVPGLFVRLKDANQFFDYLDCRVYFAIIGIFIVLIELLKQIPTFRKLDYLPSIKLLPYALIFIILSGLTIFQSRNYINPETFWESAVKSNPEKAMFLGKLGQTYYKNKQYDKAVAMLEKAISKGYRGKLDADYVFYTDLAQALYQKGKLQASIKFINKAIQANPNNIQAYIILGYYYYKNKQIEEAIETTRKVLQIDPNNIGAYRNLFCYFYDDLKLYDSASKYAYEYAKRGGDVNLEVLKFLEKYRK